MSGGPRVKICGLRRAADVRAAAAAGADYLGFVLADGPRHVQPARARELHEPVTAPAGGEAAADGAPPRAVAVLVDASVEDARS
ncbi:MAG TPA: phosphoribosylanthranilate isomerase, partial [Gemmatimonadota bacterium]|nr:phosphoribosylanthranilate isomerase [Gemmatimonadota bacterium]